MNIGNPNSNFTSKARRFTRRLSYSIGKVIREWNRGIKTKNKTNNFQINQQLTKILCQKAT